MWLDEQPPSLHPTFSQPPTPAIFIVLKQTSPTAIILAIRKHTIQRHKDIRNVV